MPDNPSVQWRYKTVPLYILPPDRLYGVHNTVSKTLIVAHYGADILTRQAKTSSSIPFNTGQLIPLNVNPMTVQGQILNI